MIVNIQDEVIEFKKIPLVFHNRNIESIFYSKNNKTLAETLKHKKYSHLNWDLFHQHHAIQLGDFLKYLKESSDNKYLGFLNKHGDSKFCEFSINEAFTDKGIYCFAINNEIKYVGRCTDNFKKRINQGYGKIHPKNCFIDGQSTNCHVNSLIDRYENVEFGIYLMNNESKEKIQEIEKLILRNNVFEWNVQTK